MTTTVRPRGPADLAVLVPYQLGYHPGPCVILTVMRGRRLGLLQRHDLSADPPSCSAVAERALAIARRESATAVLLLAYEDAPGESAPLRAAMAAAAATAGIPVHEHTVVCRGRWYAPDCRGACCPDEGLPLPRPEDVPAVAAFVRAGVAPLASRQALVEGVVPPRDEPRARKVGLLIEALGGDRGGSRRGDRFTRRPEGAPALRIMTGPGWIEEVAAAWALVLDPRPEAIPVTDLCEETLALVAASLTDITWRDALMLVLCPGAMSSGAEQSAVIGPVLRAARHCPWVDGERWPDRRTGGGDEDGDDLVLAVRARLVELSRLVPAAASPPVYTLVAHLAWWGGDGTVTGVCLERALEIDPHYRLADLMNRLLAAGLRPWTDPRSGSGRAGDGGAGDGTPGPPDERHG